MLWTLPTLKLAPLLLGCRLCSRSGGRYAEGVICEVEAYTEDDEASHSFIGRTARNASMFGPPGTAYVYQIYGLHLCFNVVTGREGVGEAVLVRALEPVEGLDVMRERRRVESTLLLCSGPARLCQALGIGKAHDGLALEGGGEIALFPAPRRLRTQAIGASRRIGISKGRSRLWRFYLRESKHLSRR